jgi:chaperonin GroEL (HSP60 family)
MSDDHKHKVITADEWRRMGRTNKKGEIVGREKGTIDEYRRARDEQPRLAALVDELNLKLLIAKRRAARSRCAHLTTRINTMRYAIAADARNAAMGKVLDGSSSKTNPESNEGETHA